jgi:hypothetical protein
VPLLGTIHCIVKEVGAYQPILISHASLGEMSDTCQSYPVVAKIRTNSGVQQAELYWTADTSAGFNSTQMLSTGQDSFYADIPGQPAGSIIHYYISAQSNQGKTITKPLPAPAGTYKFSISVPTVTTPATEHTPLEIVIRPNYPNPFNPVTTIEFSLSSITEVRVVIYNSLGEKISVLHQGKLNPGIHRLRWQAENLGSGIYFYEITAPNFREIHKIVLMK